MNNQDLLNQAAYLIELTEVKGYEILKAFLLDLAQEGYPDPTNFVDKPHPQEALLLAYTKKIGETEAVKKIIYFLESQRSVRETIVNNEKKSSQYAIGEDSDMEELRRQQKLADQS